MKTLKRILGWIRRELFFDLDRVYKDDYRKPPRNRHERRRQAKEDRCWSSEFWRNIPWFRYFSLVGEWEKLCHIKLKEMKLKNKTE